MKLGDLYFKIGIEVLCFVVENFVGRFAANRRSRAEHIGHLDRGAVWELFIGKVLSEVKVPLSGEALHSMLHLTHFVAIGLELLITWNDIHGPKARDKPGVQFRRR